MKKNSKIQKVIGILLSFAMALSFVSAPIVYALGSESEQAVGIGEEISSEVEINESEIPLAYSSGWSAITLATVLLMIVVAILEVLVSRDSENKKARNISWILVFISLVLFVANENFIGQPALFVDVETLIIASLFMLQVNLLIKSKKLL